MNVQQVREILKSEPVYLDTETTGFYRDAQVVEIAVVDFDDSVLLDTLIKPVGSIPASATAIHGITDADVIAAPTFRDILPQLIKIIDGRTLVIYNASYDLRVLEQSARVHKCYFYEFEPNAIHCAMLLYAEFWGDYNTHHHSFRWQSLSDAARQQSLIFSPNLHRALADARLTRSLMLKMGGL